MQYVVNFTSMQYVLISVDTGAEGMLSTIVAVICDKELYFLNMSVFSK